MMNLLLLCWSAIISFASGRGRRVMGLIVGLWILNAVDLRFTIFAHAANAFTPSCELNPIAACILAHGPWSLAAFKLGLLTASTVPLVILRRRRMVELAAGSIVLVYLAVVLHWQCILGMEEVRELTRMLLAMR
jgi:hypothetical protein